jgi:hypothetical protein
MTGSHDTPKTKAKMSELALARKATRGGVLHDLIDRVVISERTQAAMAAPEVRQRISERTKRALADPDTKARQIAGLKKAFSDPVLRAKISTATKIGMDKWRARTLAAARVVLRQLPRGERAGALAILNAAVGGE